MKSLMKAALVLLFLALISVLAVSFTTDTNESPQDEIESLNVSDMIVNDDGDNNYCCPPGWVIWDLNEYPDDPALKWDVNKDGFVCFKGTWVLDDGTGPGGKTPKGKGNDPLFDESNVKDNNNRCPEN